MSFAAHAFDSELHEANVWLKALGDGLEVYGAEMLAPWEVKRVLRSALHALRDRIGPANAVHLAAQLPTLVRGLYYDGWRPSATPTRERHVEDFLDRVDRALGRGPYVDPEVAVRAVFDVLWRKLDPGEVEKVRELLPIEFDELWPDGPVGVHQPQRLRPIARMEEPAW